MVLLVPDEDVTEEVTPKSDLPEQPKAQLDDSEAGKATQKVDLDLDDAPFLEDEDDEEEIEEVEVETPLFEEDEKKTQIRPVGPLQKQGCTDLLGHHFHPSGRHHSPPAS